ncbi:unnamed protein product [Symbiodinium sp. CCMP2592]|nr:unnamed protein product [Symbiodinium sp. CCMP2592]
MRGWRPTMEDSHVIHAKDNWGFFGVFDGHGGDGCSRFIAKRIKEEMDISGMPATDAAVMGDYLPDDNIIPWSAPDAWQASVHPDVFNDAVAAVEDHQLLEDARRESLRQERKLARIQQRRATTNALAAAIRVAGWLCPQCEEWNLSYRRQCFDSAQPGGSTATFVVAEAPATAEGKPAALSACNYRLRVGNVGDSRVLLGRADGSMYPGPGTDRALTTDHKPELPSERAWIVRTGGSVQEVMGVARVNGTLSVSRSFGDAVHKKTGGPSPKDHPVTCVPDLKAFDCAAPTDFLLLVCDGVSEGNFPNEAVVRLAAQNLQVPGPADPVQAAVAVCHEAIRCGSQDYVSCMVVLLGSSPYT